MTNKPRLAFLLGIVLMCFSACESTPSSSSGVPAQQVLTIKSFSDPRVGDLTSALPIETTLFVFDIDNTLLESPSGQFLGSDQWYKWQKTLDDDSPRKVKCVLQLQGAAYYMAHLLATEGGKSATYVASLQDQGYDVMALTARSPQFRPSTERELAANGFDFTKSLPAEHDGISGTYTPDRTEIIEKPRDASYQKGVAMLAGQHKGAALQDLLGRLGAANTYEHIVFFDDDQKNTDAMTEVFASRGLSGTVFLYEAVDTELDQYDLDKTVENQAAMLEAFRVFDRRTGCDI